jgi:predicted AAA+ superfamily ATPase
VTNALFYRPLLEDLQRWRDDPNRKPLVVRGARQVGKSCLVRLFAREYPRYAELNLEKPSHAALFRRGLTLSELIQAVMLECRVPAGSSPLLLFLDEIQEVPEAVAMLRFFQEERPDLHVIAAGSLLETALEAAAISFPVGRVQYLYVRPLTFAEFLAVMGEDAAREALFTVPIPAFAHAHLLNLFHSYALVGGMPEAVLCYRDSGRDLQAVNRVYADLLSAFRDDIPKYGRTATQRRLLLHTLESAPLVAGSRVTFQGFGGSDYRSREMGEALRTLERARLLELIYPTVRGVPPLMPDRRKAPRLQFLDVGLVCHVAGLQRHLIGIRDLSDVCRGRLIEQVVGQELKAIDARADLPLIFWVRDKAQSQAEVDFLLQTAAGVVPVEAKSGTAGKLRSLHEYLSRYPAPLAVRVYGGMYEEHPVQVGEKTCRLVNVPYYASGLLHRYIAQAESTPEHGA